MFTIDLLQGTGRPPRSHPFVVAGTALAFAAIGILALFLGVRYLTLRLEAAAQRKTLSQYDLEISRLADVESTLEKVEKQRKELLPNLQETSEVLSTYIQWSPVLASIGAIVPEEVVVTELMARRQNIQVESGKVDHRYSLMIGFIAGSEPVAVERFMQSLRISLEAQFKVSDIRIVSQKRQEIRNRTFLYYIVECVLKP